jgi:hypothetical protein
MAMSLLIVSAFFITSIMISFEVSRIRLEVPTNVEFILVASAFVLTFKVSRPTANHKNPQKAGKKKSRIPDKNG